MQVAPIPANEAERLAALRALLILDTPPEERFNKIVQFAIDEFEVPIALVSLVDSERQWFKAQIGLAVCETARDVSFCAHAILQSDIMLVPDTALDPRFADNPLVGGSPWVRFYAGAPLALTPGVAMGTLCILDTRPRQLDAIELALLATLRDLVVLELTQPELAIHG
ncbi:MAG: GAF domain-containing protein [Pseudomonadota bacterium]